MPDFPKMTENTCRIFSQLRKSKRSLRLKKDRSASKEECLITVRQGMWYMRVGLSEKMSERS